MSVSLSNDRAAGSGEAYCPHCFLLVETGVGTPWPPLPSRCPHCRLMIGPGRAHAAPDGVPGARGAAAGVMAERARHSDEDVEHSEQEVCDGICAVADAAGVAPERLLMVEYQQRAARDAELPQLHEVLARFGSWKQARREAAGRRRAEEDLAGAA